MNTESGNAQLARAEASVSVTPRPRVLVVDDEPGVRSVVCRALDAFGCECVPVSNGVDALASAAQLDFALVVTDLQMPRMRGMELIEKMRARGDDTPVMIMTGYADFEFAQKAIRLGVSDYLVKPIDDLGELQAAARRAIETRASRAAPDALASELEGRLRLRGQSPPAPEFDAGDLSGRDVRGYRVLDRLGEGSMGIVYKAIQLSMRRPVALKALHSRLTRDATSVRRLEREARTAARLDHPNIVRGIDVGRANGVCFFVMELVNGPSILRRLEQERVLSEEDALRLTSQVACALEHAWSVGLVHRDVTPGNMLITPTGSVKLADLGIARDTRPETPSVTGEGVALGTPYYMAPEQISPRCTVDFRADIYALGASLYHMVTGAPPFTASTPVEVLAMHLRDKAVPACARREGVSIELSSVIEKMMQKSPAHRYANGRELVEDLALVLGGHIPQFAPLIS